MKEKIGLKQIPRRAISRITGAYLLTRTLSQEISTTHTSNTSDYASFKCQYACNGNAGCVSFFGRFINVDTDQEQFQCLSFKTL